MRLINIWTLKLESFDGGSAERPSYAVLSHRWQEGEATFEEFASNPHVNRPGFSKIRTFCLLLRDKNLYKSRVFHSLRRRNSRSASLGPIDWCWADTVCIDKRSSSELSEAINSMSNWYREAKFCIAYLSDDLVLKPESSLCEEYMTGAALSEAQDRSVRKSEWFTRGWTLQELLFPHEVIFCNAAWEPTFTKSSKEGSLLLEAITGIPEGCIRYPEKVFRKCIATRMSWAGRRRTTRPEDEAYCLLGLFQINMPLIYGEGERAFLRLQKAIIEQTDDESILAWHGSERDASDEAISNGVIAHSPSLFATPQWHHYRRSAIDGRESLQMSNRGLKIEAAAIEFVQGATAFCSLTGEFSDNSPELFGDKDSLFVIELNCYESRNPPNEKEYAASILCLRAISSVHSPRALFARVLSHMTLDRLTSRFHALRAETNPVRVRAVPTRMWFVASSGEAAMQYAESHSVFDLTTWQSMTIGASFTPYFEQSSDAPDAGDCTTPGISTSRDERVSAYVEPFSAFPPSSIAATPAVSFSGPSSSQSASPPPAA